METTLVAIVLIIAGVAFLFGHYKVCFAIFAGVAFGPLGWHYIEIGDASLVYEFLFRSSLFGIACWPVHAYEKTHNKIVEPN